MAADTWMGLNIPSGGDMGSHDGERSDDSELARMTRRELGARPGLPLMKATKTTTSLERFALAP